MAYLTIQEFMTLTGGRDITDDEFDRYLLKASAVLDNLTVDFYQHKPLEADPIPSRAKRFKLALCSQIDYFLETGADTFEGLNKSPQSFSVGRTSVSHGSRYNPSGKNESKSLLAEDVYLYLEGTGLLSHRVGVRR